MKGPPQWYGPAAPPWVVYLVLCNDGTLYCGISPDVERRLQQHNAGKGARYTCGRRPVRLVWFSPEVTKSEALRWETQIKKFSRYKKWLLIKGELK